MKERLDVLLVKQGLAESREKAKAVIMAGEPRRSEAGKGDGVLPDHTGG